jgi:hypothetical protein
VLRWTAGEPICGYKSKFLTFDWKSQSLEVAGNQVTQSDTSMSPDSFHIQSAEETGPSIQAYEATIIRSQPELARKALLKHSAEQPGGLISSSHNGDSIDANEILMDRYVRCPHPATYLVKRASCDICFMGTHVGFITIICIPGLGIHKSELK